MLVTQGTLQSHASDTNLVFSVRGCTTLSPVKCTTSDRPVLSISIMRGRDIFSDQMLARYLYMALPTDFFSTRLPFRAKWVTGDGGLFLSDIVDRTGTMSASIPISNHSPHESTGTSTEQPDRCAKYICPEGLS